MLTLPEPSRILDDRPGYRPWRVRVHAILALSPSFVRVRFTAPELEGFGDAGLDQRIKILFPAAGGRLGDIGVDDPECLRTGGWYERWRGLPAGERSPFRTYTVRRIRQELGELDVDFVVHRPHGPAGEWLADAAQGDTAIVVGPDARSRHSRTGIDWRPGEATELLLVGDETAVPAVLGILESLHAGQRATAFLSVPYAADAQPVRSAADVSIVWLARDRGDEEPLGAVEEWVRLHRAGLELASAPQRLEDVDVDTELLWDSPDEGRGSFYAWLAGESSLIRDLRRLLVRENGVDRRRVAFMGYWRRGRSEAQE